MPNRAFTLIETIIYIALFGLLMTGVLTSVYGLLENSDRLSVHTTTEDEGTFVLRKLEWIFENTASVQSPSSGYGEKLSVTLTDGTHVTITKTATTIGLTRGTDMTPNALTSANVTVQSLGFYILPGGGIEASTTVDGRMFTTRSYLQK